VIWIHFPKFGHIYIDFFYSFVYYGPEGISQPQISPNISCDAPMSKSYHKSCSGYDSLQRSDECLRQNLSAPQVKSWLLANNPSLRTATETPSSSQGSTDSSGYSSDASQCESHREQSSSAKMFYFQGSYKRLSCHDKKRGNGVEASTVMNASTNPPHPPLKSNNYENAFLKDPLNTPPLPPKCPKKVPYYENHQTDVFNNKTNSKHPHSVPTSPNNCSTQTQCRCKPTSPIVEGLSRLVLTGGVVYY